MSAVIRISHSTAHEDSGGGRKGEDIVVDEGKQGEGAGEGTEEETIVNVAEVLDATQLLLQDLRAEERGGEGRGGEG